MHVMGIQVSSWCFPSPDYFFFTGKHREETRLRPENKFNGVCEYTNTSTCTWLTWCNMA